MMNFPAVVIRATIAAIEKEYSADVLAFCFIILNAPVRIRWRRRETDDLTGMSLAAASGGSSAATRCLLYINSLHWLSSDSLKPVASFRD